MDMYLEHVCKHDQWLAEFFGEIGVHPCGGRHVFLEAIRHIPNIGFIEAVPFDQFVDFFVKSTTSSGTN